MSSSTIEIRRSQLVLVLIGTAAALTLRAWLQMHFVQDGVQAELAKHLSYLFAMPVLCLFLAPVLYQQRTLVVHILRWQPAAWGMVFRGILIGLLCRVLWWTLVTLRTTLGWGTSNAAFPELLWTFECPPAVLLIVAIATMVLVTPVVEELVHRGLIQTYFARHGVVTGVVLSALFFMIFHTPAVSKAVFAMGIVLAVQFHITRSLWMSVATHGTYNGLIILDWNCLKLQWGPQPDELPMIGTSIGAATISLFAIYAIYRILRSQKEGC